MPRHRAPFARQDRFTLFMVVLAFLQLAVAIAALIVDCC